MYNIVEKAAYRKSEAKMHANIRVNRPRKRFVRKFVSFLVVTGLITALVLMIGYFGYLSLLQPISGSAADKTVVIPKGASSKQIGDIMYREGLIRNGMVFRLYLKSQGLDGKLQAGEYVLGTGMSTQDIVKRLAKGESAEFSFTIPEGYTTKQIADKLEQSGLADKEKFMDMAAHGEFNYDFIKGLPEGPARLEGYLYPDTYKIASHTTEKQIIEMMLDRFNKEISPEFRQKAAKQGLSLHQAVILASVVEREAQKDEERPKVAAVFLNRLKKGWKLESCATIQYALGVNKPRLLAQDLKIQSPYNTYLQKGLPTGPIASPGKPSLQAVVNPAAVDYMFFVVYEDGKHVFSRTLEEHNRARAAYLSRLKKD